MLRLLAILWIAALAACGSRSESLLLAPAGGDGGAGVGGGVGGDGAAPVGGGGSGATGGQGGSFANQVISTMPGSQIESEATLAVSPTGHVASAWIAVDDFGSPFVAYAFSENDGVDWLEPVAAPTPSGLASGDPVLHVATDGGFYLTWLGVDPAFEESWLYVAKADPASTTFGPAVEVDSPASGAFLDKPWLTVTNNGSVIVAYARFGMPDVSFAVARSTDGGQSFTLATIASSNGSEAYNLGFPCSQPGTNNVWIAYIQFTGLGQSVRLARSLDDGQSFLTTTVTTEPDVAYTQPNCFVAPDGLWVSYALSDDVPNSRNSALSHAVRVRRSTDGGVGFEAPVDVALPSRAPLALGPNMAINESGDLHVVWYAGAFDGDPRGSFRRGRMRSGIGAFEPSAPIQAPIVFTSARGVPDWLGDYTGVVARGDKLYAAFPENTSGASHVMFHRSFVP
jgi:hypothetical protein